MNKLMFLLAMLAVQFATFAENESDSEHFDRDELEWGESDGFQIHLGLKQKERTRKPYSLEPGYRCFVSGEMVVGDLSSCRLSSTHGFQLDNRFFIGAGLGFNSSESDLDEYFSIPIFSVFRVDFLKKKVSPFLEVRGGCDLAIDAESGFYGGLSIGCRLKRVSISIGVETMPGYSCESDMCEENINDDSLPGVENDISRAWNFNMRCSYEFSKHRK